MHFLFVVFRNLCILPIAGSSLIIKLNREILQVTQKTSNSTIEIPLFIGLEKDNSFKSEFSFWCDWIDFVNPGLESTKISAKTSLITTVYWNGFLIFGISGKQLANYLYFQKNEIDDTINFLINESKKSNEDKAKIVLELSLGVKQKLNDLIQDYSDYQNLGNFSLMSHYLFKDKKLINLLDQLYELELDCIKLEFFLNLYDMNSIKTNSNLNDLHELLKKYLPESLQKKE